MKKNNVFASKANEIAKNVKGVTSVKNDLIVK